MLKVLSKEQVELIDILFTSIVKELNVKCHIESNNDFEVIITLRFVNTKVISKMHI